MQIYGYSGVWICRNAEECINAYGDNCISNTVNVDMQLLAGLRGVWLDTVRWCRGARHTLGNVSL